MLRRKSLALVARRGLGGSRTERLQPCGEVAQPWRLIDDAVATHVGRA